MLNTVSHILSLSLSLAASRAKLTMLNTVSHILSLSLCPSQRRVRS